MYKIKSCPRCHVGDLYGDSDEYGAYEQCFQCGWVNYPGRHLSQAEAIAEKEPVVIPGKIDRRRRVLSK
ncbi:hypothetical protein Dform_00547 [Dehalogenimonas formicexedens]|uniref:Cysteine-rich CPCC domain-containing protein n=1 Tax=Dehalogenimonas formicexedens TaxID=1839801 RepID=A0A1P8F6D2_9CHLR|nr:hypothetical protein [Dehalogenimonas formicexedens]APV43902.1 hypothetical protein Dform_00547 [Dehalogenimonas formicexedens]